MSKRNWELFIEDIVQAIESICEYVKGMEFNEFREDRKTIDAVIKNFIVIGEASKKYP